VLSPFDKLYFLLQNVFGFPLQTVTEAADLVLPQRNVNLGDLWAGRKLSKRMYKNRRAPELSKLLRRGALLPF
jgi:hypothetical protein